MAEVNITSQTTQAELDAISALGMTPAQAEQKLLANDLPPGVTAEDLLAWIYFQTNGQGPRFVAAGDIEDPDEHPELFTDEVMENMNELADIFGPAARESVNRFLTNTGHAEDIHEPDPVGPPSDGPLGPHRESPIDDPELFQRLVAFFMKSPNPGLPWIVFFGQLKSINDDIRLELIDKRNELLDWMNDDLIGQLEGLDPTNPAEQGEIASIQEQIQSAKSQIAIYDQALVTLTQSETSNLEVMATSVRSHFDGISAILRM